MVRALLATGLSEVACRSGGIVFLDIGLLCPDAFIFSLARLTPLSLLLTAVKLMAFIFGGCFWFFVFCQCDGAPSIWQRFLWVRLIGHCHGWVLSGSFGGQNSLGFDLVLLALLFAGGGFFDAWMSFCEVVLDLFVGSQV